MFTKHTSLRSLRVHTGIKAGDPGTPGGGGGGNNGGGNNGGLSDAQMEAIEGRFTTMLQGGISSMAKRIEKQQGDKIDALTKLIEGMKPAAPVAKTNQQQDPDGDPDEGSRRRRNKGGAEDVEFQTMQQKLQTQEELLQSIKRERDVERQKNRNAYLRQVSTQHLAGLGITDGVSQDLAITSLIAKGTLGFESDNSDMIVWHTNTGETFEATEGFKMWSRSPEAQRLLPAVGARGSGGSRSNGNNNGAALTPEEAQSRAWSLLKDADFK